MFTHKVSTIASQRALFKSFNSKPRQILQSVFARAMTIVPVATVAFGQLGELADYAAWKRSRLNGRGNPLLAHRELLWSAILPRLISRGPLAVAEFGVAWGFATNWWLTRLTDPGIEWHGFDTFTGLPESWNRGGLQKYEPGSFSAGGRTPPIADSRAKWHVGLVGDTVSAVDLEHFKTRPLFLLFDFDLYEPTAIALKAMAKFLKPGDIMYFDEAFDGWNERQAIDKILLPHFELTCLGSTATALVLEIASVK